jgi:hypothetical protein
MEDDQSAMLEPIMSMMGHYEIPIGLMNKLMMLNNYACLEFIIDDSSSMIQHRTRWEEAQHRLMEMIAIVAYVPFQNIAITFLNSSRGIVLNRSDWIKSNGNVMDPPKFWEYAFYMIDRAFRNNPPLPSGTTTLSRKIQHSLNHYQGHAIARYYIGGDFPVEVANEVVTILSHQQDPESNPLTLLSVTNVDGEVEVRARIDGKGEEKNGGAQLADEGALIPFFNTTQNVLNYLIPC